jgi:hypothetical protein
MSTTEELAVREARAQGGIIQFAEEMQAIRDGNLYPGAKQQPDAWKTYCKERWGQSERSVQEMIQALPVLLRRAQGAPEAQRPSISAASKVASLPEKVQDAILTESPKRNDASDKAKAARKEAKRIVEQEGREATDDELIAAAAAVQAPPKKKRKMRDSRFTSLFSQGYSFIEDAADYAQSNHLSDTENDWAWDRVEKTRLQCDRIAERLYKPEWKRDWNDEAAVLLGGGEKA